MTLQYYAHKYILNHQEGGKFKNSTNLANADRKVCELIVPSSPEYLNVLEASTNPKCTTISRLEVELTINKTKHTYYYINIEK